MTVTIHIGSMVFGFFIGYVLIATVFLAILFGQRWDAGFREGWDAGKEYGKKEAEKEAEKERRAGEQDA